MSASGKAGRRASPRSWRMSSSSGHSLKPADWEDHRNAIEELYIGRCLSLEEVTLEMARKFNFHATPRMYKGRLSAWKMGKNMSKQDRLCVAFLLRTRQEAGKTASTVHVRNRLRSMKICRKFLNEFDTAEFDALAAAIASGKETIPSYIRCSTPEGSTSETSDHAMDLPQNPSNDSETKSQFPHPISPSQSPRDGRHHEKQSSFVNLGLLKATMRLPSQPNGAAATNSVDVSSESFANLSSSQDVPSLSQGQACDRLQNDVRTMVEQTRSPERLQSFAADLGDLQAWSLLSHCPGSGFLEEVCSMCGQEISKHAPVPEYFLSANATELPHEYQSLLGADADRDYSAFTAACMSACMYSVRGEFDWMSHSMLRMSSVFKQMLLNNDPLALVGVNMALIWLHAHDQLPMAGSVIRTAWRVAGGVLGALHAITITLEWMSAVALKKQKECLITSPTLRDVYRRLQETYGIRHQHTIVASYNLGYNLIQDKDYEEAESHLRRLVDISSQVLGPASLQTVSALNALSRAQASQRKYEVAITTLAQGLQYAPLGPNHPFRLASIHRHASYLKKLGRIAEEEPLRWTVLKGRIATLGAQHARTKKAREELIDLLRDLGNLEVMEREVDKLFETTTTGSLHMTQDEDWWRRVVVEGGRDFNRHP